MLWEAIGPLPDPSERHEGGLDRPLSFSANRTDQGDPPNFTSVVSNIEQTSEPQRVLALEPPSPVRQQSIELGNTVQAARRCAIELKCAR